jgi:hypothetical protein
MTVTITLDPTGGGTRLSPDQIERLARGDAMLRVLKVRGSASPRSMKLTEAQRVALELAKQNGYYRREPENVRTLAHFWHEAMGRPSIEVKPHARTVTITMDLDSAPREPVDRWRDHPSLELRLLSLARSFGANMKYAGLYNEIRAVPIGNADACAASLRDLYVELTREVGV